MFHFLVLNYTQHSSVLSVFIAPTTDPLFFLTLTFHPGRLIVVRHPLMVFIFESPVVNGCDDLVLTPECILVIEKRLQLIKSTLNNICKSDIVCQCVATDGQSHGFQQSTSCPSETTLTEP